MKNSVKMLSMAAVIGVATIAMSAPSYAAMVKCPELRENGADGGVGAKNPIKCEKVYVDSDGNLQNRPADGSIPTGGSALGTTDNPNGKPPTKKEGACKGAGKAGAVKKLTCGPDGVAIENAAFCAEGEECADADTSDVSGTLLLDLKSGSGY